MNRFVKINILITLLVLPFLASCKKEAKPSESGPKVTHISINKTKAELELFNELSLEATVYPVGQKFKVVWKSEDESIATVDAEGVVRGVKAGNVKIKASVAGLAKGAECEVTIKKASVAVKLDKTELYITINSDYGYSLKPSFSRNIENIKVKWSSDKEDVATVDNKGNVKGLKIGGAVIRVEVDDERFSSSFAECKVEVRYTYRDPWNYGPGIRIGDYVWAPVNCGYESGSGDYRGYIYGKYYQWGRKKGHGYRHAMTNFLEDQTSPFVHKGPVTLEESQTYADYFITTEDKDGDWLLSGYNRLNRWNSGTEDNPIKTEADPCPEGWRVPTKKELSNLASFYRRVYNNGAMEVYEYYDSNRQTSLYLPVSGLLGFSSGKGVGRDSYAYYLSSFAELGSSGKNTMAVALKEGRVDRESVKSGYSLRCVHQ